VDAVELPRAFGADRLLMLLMAKPRKNSTREQRIENEIVVDAYGPAERAMGWYYYLEDKIHFPFRAQCAASKVVSPLKKGETVEVLQLAPEEACTGDMLVLIRWGDRKLAVPLSQLTAIDENQSTDQAIADWQYWLAQGYIF
jgi:hypothetical protein